MKLLLRLVLLLVVVLVLAAGWLAWTGNGARADLVAAAEHGQEVESAVATGDLELARSSVASMQERTGRAQDRTSDPVWTLAAVLPWVGDDLDAVSTITAELHVVSTQVLGPVVDAAAVIDPSATDPTALDPAAVQEAATEVDAASQALASSRDRVQAVPGEELLPPVADGRQEVLDAMDRAEQALAPLAAVADVVAGL